MNHFSVIIRLLRDRPQFLTEVHKCIKLESKITSLLLSSSFFLAAYGAIMGAYSGQLQILSAALKLPALYLLTLIICLPTLYFFDVLLGSPLDFRQYVTLGLSAAGTMSVLLFSFAPVVLFFLISVQGYNFFLLLNVAVLALTGCVGIRLFYLDMRDVGGPDFGKHQLRCHLLKGWVVLYGLIGSQLGWTLSPFVGTREEPFQIFRSGIDSNFYAEVLRAMGTVLGP